MTSPFDSRFTNDPAFQTADPGDINIVASLDGILQAKGYADKRNWKSHPDIQFAANIRPAGQIHLCNKYWRAALGRSPEDTMATRFVLNDDLTPNDYIAFFENVVAPAIVRLDV